MTIVKVVFDEYYFNRGYMSIEYDNLKNLDALGKPVVFDNEIVGRVIESEFDTNKNGVVLKIEITDKELRKRFAREENKK